ncbi:MAG: ATP-dependent sacrificial sulfur transferase LarE [Thermodesulfobacteriota bacterium]|nr:ATP-dependent sacrificial sulfur transferase LarE [Thermodesulfobacteriota bacterium]
MRKRYEQKTAEGIYAWKLEDYFSRHNGAVVSYSGGVDSALIAFVAHLVLGRSMVAAMADSPSLSRREYRFALNFARKHGIPLKIVHTGEMENPLYRANRSDRCYLCKKALFESLRELSDQTSSPIAEPSWPVFYGANRDDLGDYRPGTRAARESTILSPYIELGFDKQIIRAVSAYYGLESADKPAMPCMSSRIVYGEEVTVEKLNQVEKAEELLYELGLSVLRVRHHGDTARIEVPPKDFRTLLENREKIAEKLHELGFIYIALDMDGFRSGSLNAVLDGPGNMTLKGGH